MRRPGDGKRARFESRFCPQVLSRRKRFYYKRLLLRAFASEAARQLTRLARGGRTRVIKAHVTTVNWRYVVRRLTWIRVQ